MEYGTIHRSLPPFTPVHGIGPITQGIVGTVRSCVVALVPDALRQQLKAGLGDQPQLVPVTSAAEAARAIRERPASMLLVATGAVDDANVHLIKRLVAVSAGIRAVALINEPPTDARLLLRLGAWGLRNVVDLGECKGWQELRDLLETGTDPLAETINNLFQSSLGDSSTGVRQFLSHLVRSARVTRTLQELASDLDIRPSTLASRFHRARLPSPKVYLSSTRLLFAKAMLDEDKASLSGTANALRYSSPQAFGRHVRQVLGAGTGDFRSAVSFNRLAEHFLDALVHRHRSTLRTFDPFGLANASVSSDRDIAPSYLVH